MTLNIQKLNVPRIKHYIVVVAAILLLLPKLNAQSDQINPNIVAGEAERHWVDSIFNAMTEDERLGQLFMIRAHSDLGADHIAKVEAQIKKYHVGSLCFFQGNPEKQIDLINRYQQLNRHVPLLVAMDAEWGLGMRMRKSTIYFPRQMMLGAVQDNHLLYEMGAEIAGQLRRIGVHVNFAPVADINNNASNPVINFRSFGENRYNVTVKSFMYMKGMQDNQVMGCAKHFPGHGDTGVDSHHDLPVIAHDRKRLDSLELYPFDLLAQKGVGSMMIAHLDVPALDARPNRPASLSRNVITNILKDSLGFKGLIFTDALEMQGVRKHFKRGQIEAEALYAGNDVIVLPQNLEAAISEIKAWIADGRISLVQVYASVKKMLSAKYRTQLTQFTPLSTEDIRQKLNTSKGIALKRKLIENALTLVRNENELIPLQEGALSLASLSIGANATRTKFQHRLADYGEMTFLQTGKEISGSKANSIFNTLKQKDAVIISLHGIRSYSTRNFGITASAKRLIQRLNLETKVILVVFGTPYSLRYFDEIDHVLGAYDEDEITQDIAAQALFGAVGLNGRLPVTASSRSTYNTGVYLPPSYRLGYGLPEGTGLNGDSLNKIDLIAQHAVDSAATPGCVVLVAKDGNIVFNKAYGYHTYSKRRKVEVDDIYDLASITKVAATTLALMKLQDQGRIHIDDTLGQYLPELDTTNKAGLVIRDILAHRSGLKSWIPFYKNTVSDSRRYPKPLPEFYKSTRGGGYNVPVTDRLFMNESYLDSIWIKIFESDLRSRRDYRYSDLGFFLLSRLVEKVSDMPLDEYVKKEFYEPLGLKKIDFKPWEEVSKSSIPPTERDRYFRRQDVQGYVHDMGAAMLGGVGGHAGLFSDTKELAVLMQMLLQKGYYGGRRYLSENVVKEFTTRHPKATRRGLGFDLKQTATSLDLNMSGRAPENTFGHLGFTGTCVWADSDNNIIYIFLSNRTYPSMKNYKLNKMNIRPRIQSAIYRAMERE